MWDRTKKRGRMFHRTHTEPTGYRRPASSRGRRLPCRASCKFWTAPARQKPSARLGKMVGKTHRFSIGSWLWDDPYAIDDDWPSKEKPLRDGSMAITLGGLRWSQGLHKSGTYDLGLCLSAHALPQGTRWPLPSWGTGVSWDGNVEFFNESLGIWEAHKKTANKSTKLM